MALTPVDRNFSDAGELVFKCLVLLEINGKQRSWPAPAWCATGENGGGDDDKKKFNWLQYYALNSDYLIFSSL
jgi:hypothetical protein